MSVDYEPVDRGASLDHQGEDVSKYHSTSKTIPLRDFSYPGPDTDELTTLRSKFEDKKGRNPSWALNAHAVFSRFWTWELLASLFSMICIAVIIIVLLYENGKRLDQWKLIISPNAVISFITTLAKASCMLVLAEVIGQLRVDPFCTSVKRVARP